MNPDITLPKLSVLDSEMAYRKAGRTDAPVALFLHGNPISSYLWRNIIPLVAKVAYCIAPDLIGFGQSGKPDIACLFGDHVRYLDAFIAKAGIGPGLSRRPGLGNGARLPPRGTSAGFRARLGLHEVHHASPELGGVLRVPEAREMFRKFRTPGEGEKLILEANAFVEQVLPSWNQRKLTEEEMSVYRAPFATPQARRPTWRFPNEPPIAGKPADVYATLEMAHAALAASTYPKLLFCTDPGALVSPALAESLARELDDCRLVKLGSGVHLLQEDHPETVGQSVAAFIGEVDGRSAETAA
jgi:haloalkane dehalogenase